MVLWSAHCSMPYKSLGHKLQSSVSYDCPSMIQLAILSNDVHYQKDKFLMQSYFLMESRIKYYANSTFNKDTWLLQRDCGFGRLDSTGDKCHRMCVCIDVCVCMYVCFMYFNLIRIFNDFQ